LGFSSYYCHLIERILGDFLEESGEWLVTVWVVCNLPEKCGLWKKRWGGGEFYNALLAEMLDELARADADRSPGEGYGGMILIVRRSIGGLREAVEPFADGDAEVAFFRGVWRRSRYWT
jgi:hypothetical protein